MNRELPGAWRVYGRAVAFVLAVLFAVGTAGHLHAATLSLMIRLTPWFGVLTGLLVAIPAVVAGGWRFPAWLAGTYVFTFWAEAAGVATGAVFGEYEYGPTMGWSWQGVPLLIAFNWAMVVHGCFCLGRRMAPLRLGRFRHTGIVLLTGLLATGFDWIMEPVAMHLDYWRWPGNVVPLQNYAAWFCIAALTSAFHPRTLCTARRICSTGRLAGFYVILQAGFFIALRTGWHLQGG